MTGGRCVENHVIELTRGVGVAEQLRELIERGDLDSARSSAATRSGRAAPFSGAHASVNSASENERMSRLETGFASFRGGERIRSPASQKVPDRCRTDRCELRS